MKMRLNNLALAFVLTGSALLVACGDGGGGGSASILTVSGTAATGAPLVSSVTVTCKTGSGSATSNLDGSFTVLVTNGVGPCLLSLTANGTTLFSVTSGNAATQVANITPMTNLLVRYLSNVPGMVALTPADWFALSTTQSLLADTTALNTRIVNDFIPAVIAIEPTLLLTNASFLSTAFKADPAVSNDDADLETLLANNVVTDTGAPEPATITTLDNAALDDTEVIAPTTPTGGSGSAG